MKKNQAAAASDQAKQIRSCQKKTTIGGQALIEGLMMIGPTKKAMAVRKADGSIHLEQLPMTKFTGTANMPFIRGSVRMFRQLVSGTGALMKSAEFVEEEAETAGETAEGEAKPAPKPKSKFDLFLEKHSNLLLYVSATMGILFSVVLFILLPNFITSFIQDLTGLNRLKSAGDTILLSLIEGLIRIGLFVGYLALASKMKDIKRVWMYHGAEHKAIACYEDRKELTVDNVRSYSRFHPRCGTAFMFVVIIVSIIVFAFAGWWGRWINLLIRFALVPLVAGIAYEIIRLAGRFDNKFTRVITAPGLWLQRLTTAEPDDGMLEVSIAALTAVLPEEPQSDTW